MTTSATFDAPVASTSAVESEAVTTSATFDAPSAVVAVDYAGSGSGSATFASPSIVTSVEYTSSPASSATFATPTASGSIGAVTYNRSASASASLSTPVSTGDASIGVSGDTSATFATPNSSTTREYAGPATGSAIFASPSSAVIATFERTAAGSATFPTPTASASSTEVTLASASATFALPSATVTVELDVVGAASASSQASTTTVVVSERDGDASFSTTIAVTRTVEHQADGSASASISASAVANANDLNPTLLEAMTAHVSTTATRELPSQSVSVVAAMSVSSGRQPVGPSDPLQKTVTIHGVVLPGSESQIPITISGTVIDSISVIYGVNLMVDGSVAVSASSSGGSRNFDGDVGVSLSSSASANPGSGSRYFPQVIIDGVGSIGTTLNSTFEGEVIIDGIASLSAPLLTEGEVVTVVQIWNVALVELGVGTVGTTSDGSAQAILLNTVWDGGFRAQFLADHAWNGAKRTIGLTTFKDSSGDAVSPSGTRWSNAYDLPEDYLRALTINGLPMQPNGSRGQNQWEIEVVSDGESSPTLKRCLLSNEGTISLEYVMDLGDVNIGLLSPLVAHAMGLALAAFVATNFGKPPTEQAFIGQRAADALLAAKGVDGQESSPRMFSSTSLLDVRR